MAKTALHFLNVDLEYYYCYYDNDEGLISNTVVAKKSCCRYYLLVIGSVVMIDGLMVMVMARRSRRRDSSVRTSLNACYVQVDQWYHYQWRYTTKSPWMISFSNMRRRWIVCCIEDTSAPPPLDLVPKVSITVAKSSVAPRSPLFL